MPYSKEKQREYAKAHYYANREAYLARSRTANAKRRDEVTAYVRDLKSSTPCADCEVQYHFAVMQFDHLGDKKADIAKVVRIWSLDQIKAEIAKCEIVCANCHQMRTWNRLQS